MIKFKDIPNILENGEICWFNVELEESEIGTYEELNDHINNRIKEMCKYYEFAYLDSAGMLKSGIDPKIANNITVKNIVHNCYTTEVMSIFDFIFWEIKLISNKYSKYTLKNNNILKLELRKALFSSKEMHLLVRKAKLLIYG